MKNAIILVTTDAFAKFVCIDSLTLIYLIRRLYRSNNKKEKK
jgi:hypothetical protein